MTGLEDYIKKHGRHFTEELAMNATKGRWNTDEIVPKAKTFVYYNITGSTVGDTVFLVNFAKDSGKSFLKTKHQCIKFALCIIGEYTMRDGAMFNKWVGDTKDFDFTPYI